MEKVVAGSKNMVSWCFTDQEANSADKSAATVSS